MNQTAKSTKEDHAPEIKIVRGGYARGVAIPWQAKMWIKIILSKLPFSYSFLSRFGIFRHGDTATDLKTLFGSFNDHFSFYKTYKGSEPENCLELGVGDSVGHALCAMAAGAKSMWLVDVGDFATRDEDHYRQVCGDLKLSPPSFDRDTVLKFANGRYETKGQKSLEKIPAGTIDFSFSHAVFEHVYRDEFQAHMHELYRVHRPGSVSRHWVDLHDHLGGALNNLRFSPKFWESYAVRHAGFYTNRLTMNEMISMAEKAGFRVRINRIHRWESLPTPLDDIHESLRDKSEDELNVCTFLMVMEK